MPVLPSDWPSSLQIDASETHTQRAPARMILPGNVLLFRALLATPIFNHSLALSLSFNPTQLSGSCDSSIHILVSTINYPYQPFQNSLIPLKLELRSALFPPCLPARSRCRCSLLALLGHTSSLFIDPPQFPPKFTVGVYFRCTLHCPDCCLNRINRPHTVSPHRLPLPTRRSRYPLSRLNHAVARCCASHRKSPYITHPFVEPDLAKYCH
jgi:hypothetical protein